MRAYGARGCVFDKVVGSVVWEGVQMVDAQPVTSTYVVWF